MFPPVSYWSTLRTAIAITVLASIVIASTGVWSVHVGAQGTKQSGR